MDSEKVQETKEGVEDLDDEARPQINLQHLIYKKEYSEVGHEMMSDIQKQMMALRDQNLKLNNNRWNIYSIADIFQGLDSMKLVKIAHLEYNSNQRILQQIAQVNFPSLVNLNISYNNISTLDSLSDLSAPNLRALNICHNKITCLKPLRKLYCPNLCNLSLENNPFRDGWFLTTLYAKLQQNCNNENLLIKCTITNVSWYFKLESTCPRILISYQSMKNKSILCKLKAKIAS